MRCCSGGAVKQPNAKTTLGYCLARSFRILSRRNLILAVFGRRERLPTIVSDSSPKSLVVARRAASTNHVNFSLDYD
jgi:hypothetical protein